MFASGRGDAANFHPPSRPHVPTDFHRNSLPVKTRKNFLSITDYQRKLKQTDAGIIQLFNMLDRKIKLRTKLLVVQKCV
eukprot:snap_masked-scaffold_2-processed-gene-25.20-mRNA-1 protein AED:1.00 eAED:1.00 QI:0/0/0/0/1/1/2/0/78